MAYTPVANRKVAVANTPAKSSGYVSIAARQQTSNPKRTLYKTPDGFVMNASQLNQYNQQQEKPGFSVTRELGSMVDRTAEVATSVGQTLLRGGASIGATFLSPILNKGEMVNEFPTGVGVLSSLIGPEPLKTIPGLFQEAKAVLPKEKYGEFESTTIAIGASLAPLLDLTGFEGKGLNLALKGTRTTTEAATILRKIGVAEDLVEPYANVFAKAKTAKEVQKGLDGLEKVLTTSRQTEKGFQGFTDLSTNTLEKLRGRSQVSKQFISDLTNSADMKQAERDVIRNALQDEGDIVNVQTFANKVKTELLPLKTNVLDPTFKESHSEIVDRFVNNRPRPTPSETSARYENVSLPESQRGNVADYRENIYQSPIKTGAGDIHFSSKEYPNYFAHTRVEDMARPGKGTELYQIANTAENTPRGIRIGSTRRVIELQSDLFQKGNLDRQTINLNEDALKQKLGYDKLEPYRNTWHERVIREEVKQAAVDGKTKLQFPTGETAMKIEGLGETGADVWGRVNERGISEFRINGQPVVTPENIKVGEAIVRREGLARGQEWIITDVLGDGKFKAVPKDVWDSSKSVGKRNILETDKESFDISGKVDTNNPIYRFYEKEVGRYLTNKYGAKQITDSQGVKWWQVDINPGMARGPVSAFAGVPAGFETDEQGNVKFNPAKAAFGVLLAGLTHDESFIKSLAKLSDEGKIANLLRKAGMAEEMITKIASRIAQAKKGEDVIKILDEAVAKIEPTAEELKGLAQSKGLPELPKVGPAANQLPTNTPFGEHISQSQQVSIDKVTQALKDAKPIRSQQEQIYTTERAKRAGEAIAAGEKVSPGEEKFYKQLGQLKGEFPKVDFEGIRNNVSQTDIDNLFHAVQAAPHLDFFEKVSAQTGLGKLFGKFGGQVPTEGELKLLNEIFPKEFIASMLEKRSMWVKAKDLFQEIINIPKAIRSSFDLSAPFRQGLFLINHPKAFFGNIGPMFKAFASEGYYKEIIAEIKSRPSYSLMKDANLALMDITATLSAREEAFLSNLAEKINLPTGPKGARFSQGLGVGQVVKSSGRAYTGFLDRLRADVFDDMIRGAEAAGRSPSTDAKLLKAIGNHVNTFSGRGKIGFLEPAAKTLNGVFFSPRLMMSRLQILNPYYYIKADPFIRKEALKSLFTVTAGGLTALSLAKLAGAEVGVDPTSADFGKIIIGKTRIDVWGGTQQYIRMAAQVILGKYTSTTTDKTYNLGEGYKPITRLDIISRQFQSKESPIAAFITNLLKGVDYVGRPINVSNETKNLFTPLILSDMVEVAKNDPWLLPFVIPMAALGFGVQSYSPTPPKTTNSGEFPKTPGLPKLPKLPKLKR